MKNLHGEFATLWYIGLEHKTLPKVLQSGRYVTIKSTVYWGEKLVIKTIN